jgi:hypothetical protein
VADRSLHERKLVSAISAALLPKTAGQLTQPGQAGAAGAEVRVCRHSHVAQRIQLTGQSKHEVSWHADAPPGAHAGVYRQGSRLRYINAQVAGLLVSCSAP